MSKRVTVSINDDYAVLHAGVYRFYYGYEETLPPNDAEGEWCFVAFVCGTELERIPKSKLGEGDCAELLLTGIGHVIRWHGIDFS